MTRTNISSIGQPSEKSRTRELAVDGLIAISLAALLGLLSLLTFAYLDPVLYGLEGLDFWFQSDMTRVFYNMTGADFSHYRASVHPLFSLFGTYSTRIVLEIFGRISGYGMDQAVQLVISMVAFFWMGALYTMLRLLSLQRVEAVIFSLLGAFSSASLFWFSVPETYTFGSLSILFALLVAAVSQHKAVSEGWYVAANVATFSFTITNWMSGLAATYCNLGIIKALRTTFVALLCISILWLIQKQLFPTAGFFLHNSDEANYLMREESGGPLRILLSFFSTSVVMPDFELAGKMNRPDWKILTVQHSYPWSGGWLVALASFSWLVLLGIGLGNLCFGSLPGRIRLTIGLTLAGQVLLHLLYGEETFLYSLHYLPLLIITASLAVIGKFRRVSLVLALIVIMVGGVNNVLKFREARDVMIHHFYPERDKAERFSAPVDISEVPLGKY